MKTKLNSLIALAGTFTALALSSCTTNVNPTSPATGAATSTTTTQQQYPYSGTSSTTRKTTTVQY